MKQGWEIKKLGDITTSINGLWTGKKPPFITIAVIRNTNFTKDCKLDTSDIAYIDVEVKQYACRKLQCGDIIIEKSGGSDKQPVGRPILFNIEEGEYSFSNFTSTMRVNDKATILPEFIHRYLAYIYARGDTAAMQSKTTGIRNLDFTLYKSIQVPIPPREEQEKIVEELDCLSGVIERKREQLKELNALAQSIFYQMFGDPITNEKGWEVKKLGEVASEIFAGGDRPKDFSDIQTDEYLYPIYANGEGDRGLLGYSKTYRVESKAVALGARGASIGNCRICEGKFTPVVRLITIIPSNKIDIIYLFYSVRTMSFNISGAGQAQLTTPNVINKSITIPPLSLQQEFADKIEAIEKQMELIKKSITQTEELFNSRMSYYFN